MTFVKFLPILAIGACINFLPIAWSWIGFFVKGALYVVLYAVYAFFVCCNKEEKGLVTGFAKKLFKRA